MKVLNILAALVPFLAFNQDLDYAREIVNTLASKEYYGRGYVNDGDKKAAEFIASQYEEIGLKSFKKKYYQKFSTAVNTFPSTIELSINGEEKIAGVDYLIEPGSPGIKGTFQTLQIPIEHFFDQGKLVNALRSSAGKFIVVPTYDKKKFSKEQQKQITDIINFIRYSPDHPAAGSIVLTNDKLTWSGSTFVNSKPSITLTSTRNDENVSTVKLNLENRFYEKYQTQNVIGYQEGTSDSMVVFTAHYDHLGMMGPEAMFPGANDNASGIAMLLNIAKHFQANKPKYSMVFIAFGGEEIGLLGSKHFVDNPYFELSKIKFLLNFDMSGTGDDGIQVVNGKVHRAQFDRMGKINEERGLLKQVKIRGEACNSDHCMFHMKNVPCFFIYTLGGIQAYHDVYDKAETLPLTEFEDYFRLLVDWIEGI